MENKERQIKDFEKSIEKTGDLIRQLYLDSGSIAYAEFKNSSDDSSASTYMTGISKLDRLIADELSRKDNIIKTAKRSDEIEEIRKSLKQQIRLLEKDNISNYETIGRASFEAFRQGSLPMENYEQIFADIIGSKEKIKQLEDDQIDIEAALGREKLLRKVQLTAKKISNKSSISSQYRLLSKHYRKAGEQICNSELIMNLEADSVKNAVQPFRDNLDGMEKLEMEDQQLHLEKEELRGSLEGLGAGDNLKKTIADLDQLIAEYNSEREELLVSVGEILYNNQKDPLSDNDKMKDIFSQINDANSEITVFNAEIEKLKAEAEIEKQNKEIQSLNKKIYGYEEKIQSFSDETGKLKDQIKKAEDEIKKLETVIKEEKVKK